MTKSAGATPSRLVPTMGSGRPVAGYYIGDVVVACQAIFGVVVRVGCVVVLVLGFSVRLGLVLWFCSVVLVLVFFGVLRGK